jgi:hypothetical protein
MEVYIGGAIGHQLHDVRPCARSAGARRNVELGTVSEDVQDSGSAERQTRVSSARSCKRGSLATGFFVLSQTTRPLTFNQKMLVAVMG